MSAMTLEQFEATLDGAAPPAGLDPLQQALWHEAKGDWALAHELAQSIDDADGAWVHAYLTGSRATWPTPATGIAAPAGRSASCRCAMSGARSPRLCWRGDVHKPS
jgi:hypothetical protein